MSSLTLKNIPPVLLERLRAQAARERRSLSAEAITIIERALCGDYRSPEQRAATVRALQAIADAGGKEIDWDVDAIYAARSNGLDPDS